MTVRNFSGGPGALPASVLREAALAVAELPGTGVSILGLSHRSRQFREILDEAEERLRRLLGVPSSHHVLFLQGGGTLQFSMVPLSMLPNGASADYILSGYWSGKSVEAARCHGNVRVAWDGTPHGFDRLPPPGSVIANDAAAYLHYVSNETVEGLQFREPPTCSVPLVCDMSSDFLGAPFDVSRFSIVYAHAQKNIGPAGVTVVLVRDDVLRRMPSGLPPLLDYRSHAAARSVFHTPPVFSIYVVLLVLRWLESEVGGLEQMAAINAEKASIVRSALSECREFYVEDVKAGFESCMNITFRTRAPALDVAFAEEGARAGLIGMDGHRSRGGLRISLYDAVTIEDARAAASWIHEFRDEHLP